jgi:hypothetical protein
MHDLPHPAFVLNLRWDVLGFNMLADKLFNFAVMYRSSVTCSGYCSPDSALRARVVDWDEQAPLMLSTFAVTSLAPARAAIFLNWSMSWNRFHPSSKPGGDNIRFMRLAMASAVC